MAKTTVFITIDTEEDQWGEYNPAGATVENVLRMKPLQELFDAYGAVPTYLVNFPVVNNREACSWIKSVYARGRCGIGTHCHPWNTPPFHEAISERHSMMCNLPRELILEKLRRLHRAIEQNLGVSPVCFRAGRWGFGAIVADCIVELGYRVDSSVTPFYDWSGSGGPDFSEAPAENYSFHPCDILSPVPGGEIVEIPPTIGFLQSDFRRCASIRKVIRKSVLGKWHVLGILDKLRLVNFRWLSPELSSGSDMVLLGKSFIRKGHCSLNMSFHSSSMLPGKSPYTKSNLEVTDFLARIETFLSFAARKGFSFRPLDVGTFEG
jgi:hypothetical protein